MSTGTEYAPGTRVRVLDHVEFGGHEGVVIDIDGGERALRLEGEPAAHWFDVTELAPADDADTEGVGR